MAMSMEMADARKLLLHHRPSGALQTRPPDPESAWVRKPSRQTMTRTPASCTFRTMRQSQEFVQRTTRTPAFRTVHSMWKRIAGGRSWWSVCYFNRHLITSYHCSPDRIDIPHLTHGLLTTLYFGFLFSFFFAKCAWGRRRGQTDSFAANRKTKRRNIPFLRSAVLWLFRSWTRVRGLSVGVRCLRC